MPPDRLGIVVRGIAGDRSDLRVYHASYRLGFGYGLIYPQPHRCSSLDCVKRFRRLLSVIRHVKSMIITHKVL